MGYQFQTEEDVRRVVRSVLSHERQAFPAIRPTQHQFTPFSPGVPAIPCVNSSGTTIPAYGLVKKSGVAPSGRVQCVRPDSTWGQYLVNGASDVPAGQDFSAYGTGQVNVLSITGNGSPSLGPVPNSFTARFGNPLIEYFGQVSGGGPAIGVLRQPNVLIGKPTANISLGSSGTMAVYDSARVAISPQLTVAISYAYASLVTTKFMSAVYNAGAWYGAPLEC